MVGFYDSNDIDIFHQNFSKFCVYKYHKEFTIDTFRRIRKMDTFVRSDHGDVESDTFGRIGHV